MKRILCALLCLFLFPFAGAFAVDLSVLDGLSPEELQQLIEAANLMLEDPQKSGDSIDAMSGLLSGDIFAYEVAIDGTLFTFPCPFSAFTGEGWKFKDEGDADLELGASTYASSIELVRGSIDERQSISVQFINFDISTQPLPNCYVGGIRLEKPYSKSQKPVTAVMAKGVALGVSAREDIVAAYGEPTSIYESDTSDYVTLSYEQRGYQSVEFKLIDKVLDTIRIQNFSEPADMPRSEVSDEVPDYIKEYVAPAELGDDPLSLVVEYEGDLYRLPAPVSAFEANGWKVVKTRADFVGAHDTSSIEMRREGSNDNFRFYIQNYSDQAVLPANCAVNELTLSAYNAKEGRKLVLPGGITIGSTKDELMAVFADLFTSTSAGDKETTYTARERRAYTYYIYVDNATKLVTYLSIEAD
jgi:hypothetical protein